MGEKMERKMWGIVGTIGLYCGTSLSKREMIAKHIATYDQELYVGYHGTLGNRLSPKQKQIWRRRQRAGDRAVKLRISWACPSQDKGGR